ncbi:MAG TPA: DUF1343 domain-containing protein [Candidatus Kapabacteria bacterium]|nr:DUF1343 domain-containing protein [Candidatus Kapabacteria bacterium]
MTDNYTFLAKRFYLLFFLIVFPSLVPASTRCGLDALLTNKFTTFKGKRVALICNQTSRTLRGEFAPDIFLKQRGFSLVAIFMPEHGLNGSRKAGMKSDTTEDYRGIRVYSLYGTTRKPTKVMLRGVDAIVFDLQDIGVRSYTYLSTMILAMESAAENKIEFIVLDRPNPLGGERIEGNILDTTLRSFVGQVPIPYIHGMTLGELAKMAKGERWFRNAEKLKLTVIPMQGWSRTATWDKTSLEWKATSPNIPTFESAVGCAMFGAIGELGELSVGVNSDQPFLRLGSRLVSRDELFDAVKTSLSNELTITQEDFTVSYGDSVKTYNGIRISLPKNISAVSDLYSGEFKLFSTLLRDTIFAKAFDSVPFSSKRMFEKVTGTSILLRAFQAGSDVGTIIHSWKQDELTFRTRRKKYLLYQ